MTQVYVSIGSNIDRVNNIRSGVRAMRRAFGDLLLSSVYDSQAVGFDGDDFYNLVACFSTGLDVYSLAARLREIEDRHQRRRDGARFSSRTLDIDLLLYNDLVLNEQGLVLPREEITRNAFVLGPLAEIAGQASHPVLGISYQKLWEAFDRNSQPMRRIEFDW